MNNSDIYEMSRLGLLREVCHLRTRNAQLEASIQAEKELTTYWMERAVAAEDSLTPPQQR